jgi:nicotinate-nucleotide adenylyltransferase
LIGLLGGTFDPIHFGHLRLAEEVAEALDITELRLIPAGAPPHRGAPGATAADRLAMARLAVEGNARLLVDDCEVRAAGAGAAASYTVLTLEALRSVIGPQRPLALLMGADAFAGFARWHRWQAFAGLAHLVVTTRPGHDGFEAIEPALRDFWWPRITRSVADLHARACGSLFFQPITALDISATRIRALLAAGASTRYLMPEPVRAYALERGLYRAASLSQDGA